ncbi:MAG: GNAT family N-acetyltransferase [Gemmatimonadaceae bacterium]|nr:GNAT family N-acetyltransferase [Gemmatimonadaceae bacterium]
MSSTEAPLQLVAVTTWSELSGHLDAWNGLLGKADIGDWFASPHWVVPWMRAFGENSPWHLILGYRNGELVGALPLIGPVPAPWGLGTLRQPVNVQVRRVGMLAVSATMGDFCNQALQAAIAGAPNHCVELARLERRGWFDRTTARITEENNWRHLEWDEQPSAIVDLTQGWEHYLTTRDGKLLRNLRSRRRKIETDSAWEIHSIDNASAFEGFWQAVLRIEQDSWKHDAQSALTNEPHVAAFYHDVLEQVGQNGFLRSHLLTHAGEPVAYTAAVAIGRTCYLLKNSYRAEYRSWSPGMVLTWHSIEAGAHAGATRYDFLGDVLPWKQDLATELPAYFSRTVFPRYQVSPQLRRFVEHGVKPLVRRSGVLAALRNKGSRD